MCDASFSSSPFALFISSSFRTTQFLNNQLSTYTRLCQINNVKLRTPTKKAFRIVTITTTTTCKRDSSSSSNSNSSSSDSSPSSLPSSSNSFPLVPQGDTSTKPTQQQQQQNQQLLQQQFAGGKGLLSREFLNTSGALATLLGLLLFFPVALFRFSSLSLSISKIVDVDTIRRVLLTTTSFLYGILLSRFDLKRAKSLKFIILFALTFRVIALPFISHFISLVTFSILPSTLTTSTLLSTSLFVSSCATPFFSPSLAQLSMHVHTTLLAILITTTMLIFPFLPTMSYIVSKNSAWLKFGISLPPVLSSPPPNPFILASYTTLPFVLGLYVTRSIVLLSSTSKAAKIANIITLSSLPLSWFSSLCLIVFTCLSTSSSASMSASTMHIRKMLIQSIFPCFFSLSIVFLFMFLLAAMLARMLSLRDRARRALILYFITPGITIASGIAAISTMNLTPLFTITMILISTIVITILAYTWSKVTVVRTSDDVI